MVVVDLKKIGLFTSVRKKLKRAQHYNPVKPHSGVNAFPLLEDGIYQMRRRPYKGPGSVPGGSTRDICVREVFYEPSDQTQPNKVARQIVFAAAVLAYQGLTDEQKKIYHKKAYGKHMSGYNLFLRNYLNTH